MIEITLQLESILNDHADRTGFTVDTRPAEVLVDGVLTVEYIAQDIRLIILNTFIQFIEIGFLYPEFTIDKETLAVGTQMYSFTEQGRVSPSLEPLPCYENDDKHHRRNRYQIYPVYRSHNKSYL